MLFLGDDWAEAHHDIEIQDEAGRCLVQRRLPEGVAGIATLHGMLADAADDAEVDPAQVHVGIETDRGAWVQALLAAGYRVYAVNPLSVSRYRDRHVTSGAKSDAGDAHVLADLVRVDRDRHRPITPNSDLAEAVKILARTHQNLIWSRQRQANLLRSTLREFYPAALAAFPDLDGSDALAVLALAPTPARGRALSRSRIESALRRGGRQRHVASRTHDIQAALAEPQLQVRPLLADALGQTVSALVPVLATLTAQIERIEGRLTESFRRHPDAAILLSQPGLGPVLGARVLGEFGDDRTRYATPKNRKNYAGTSPITRASGTKRIVLTRYAVNSRLRDALHMQAFTALRTAPGAHAYYQAHRTRGASHHAALRALSNRLVGILHGCLRHRTAYNEARAWPARQDREPVAA